MERKYVKLFFRIILLAIIAIIELGGEVQAAESAITLSNPRSVDDNIMQAGRNVTYDCIYFGSYPQAEVVSEELAGRYYGDVEEVVVEKEEGRTTYEKLVEESTLYEGLKSDSALIVDDDIYNALNSDSLVWDDNGDTIYNGEKYRRMKSEDAEKVSTASEKCSYLCYHWTDEVTYHYFKYQPIKWRVLSVNEEEALLFSDICLDAKRFNNKSGSTSWKKSTLRSWLNGYPASYNSCEVDYSMDGSKSFIDTAFNEEEQAVILTNGDLSEEARTDCAQEEDKILLLFGTEAWGEQAEKYGFVQDEDIADEARRAKSSTYAKAMGGTSDYFPSYNMTNLGNMWWWLCLPGENVYEYEVDAINSYGGKSNGCRTSGYAGVRVALHLNLSGDSHYTVDGTIASDSVVNTCKMSVKETTDGKLKSPEIVADYKVNPLKTVTYDCIYFGSYPQAEVITSEMSKTYTGTVLSEDKREDRDVIVSDALYQKLKEQKSWYNDDAVIDGTKYRRVNAMKPAYANILTERSFYDSSYNWSDKTTYHYFQYQPVKWRVLDVDGENVFLLADKTLDDQQYHRDVVSVTWEESTVRSWLNGYGADKNSMSVSFEDKNFINYAFTESEQSAINTVGILNENGTAKNITGGNNTEDKIFLLSEKEVYYSVKAEKYGFDYKKSEARKSKSSTFAKAMGVDIDGQYCYWWLRSPGSITSHVSGVRSDGTVNSSGTYAIGGWGQRNTQQSVVRGAYGIRPALWLDVTDSSNWIYAGTVCTDGTEQGEHVDYWWGLHTEANCTEAEKITYTCEECGQTKDEIISPATGHDYGEWKITQAATSAAEGIETRTCSKCGQSEERCIPKLDESDKSSEEGNASGNIGETSTESDTTGNTGGTTAGGNTAGNVSGGSESKENSVVPSTKDASTKDDVMSEQKQVVPKVKKLKVKARKGKMIITWNKLSDVSGYELQVGTKKNFKGTKKIKRGNNIKIYSMKTSKSKKKYYIRIRAYKDYKNLDGTNQRIYGKWVVTSKKAK